MKTVAYVSLFAIALLIYSLGAFIPETQSIPGTYTVSGLAVLSDTYLAEQVGGDHEGRRKLVKKAGALIDCNISSGNCGSGSCGSGSCMSKEEEKDACDLIGSKVSNRAKYNCIYCPAKPFGKKDDRYRKMKVSANIKSWCVWDYNTETCVRKTASKGPGTYSCDKQIGQCRK